MLVETIYNIHGSKADSLLLVTTHGMSVQVRFTRAGAFFARFCPLFADTFHVKEGRPKILASATRRTFLRTSSISAPGEDSWSILYEAGKTYGDGIFPVRREGG